MTFSYYPGCTMYEQAKNFELSTLESAQALGIELEELADWQCCGAVYPLVTDNLFPLVSAARNLAAVESLGRDMVTLCSGCYHVHKRTSLLASRDPESREKLEAFIEAELPGRARVLHFLEVLRDEVGFDVIRERAEQRLGGLKVASYYGCLLLRPAAEMQFDDPEAPTLMQQLAAALGAEVVDFPQAIECCGAYLSLSRTELAAKRVERIVAGARLRGADVLVTSCPLCQFNLDSLQQGEERMPVLYFSQLLALGLGLGPGVCRFELHDIDPHPALEAVGIAGEVV